jgi:hypothetical protein
MEEVLREIKSTVEDLLKQGDINIQTGDPHHVGYERQSKSGKMQHIQQKGAIPAKGEKLKKPEKLGAQEAGAVLGGDEHQAFQGMLSSYFNNQKELKDLTVRINNLKVSNEEVMKQIRPILTKFDNIDKAEDKYRVEFKEGDWDYKFLSFTRETVSYKELYGKAFQMVNDLQREELQKAEAALKTITAQEKFDRTETGGKEKAPKEEKNLKMEGEAPKKEDVKEAPKKEAKETEPKKKEAKSDAEKDMEESKGSKADQLRTKYEELKKLGLKPDLLADIKSVVEQWEKKSGQEIAKKDQPDENEKKGAEKSSKDVSKEYVQKRAEKMKEDRKQKEAEKALRYSTLIKSYVGQPMTEEVMDNFKKDLQILMGLDKAIDSIEEDADDAIEETEGIKQDEKEEKPVKGGAKNSPAYQQLIESLTNLVALRQRGQKLMKHFFEEPKSKDDKGKDDKEDKPEVKKPEVKKPINKPKNEKVAKKEIKKDKKKSKELVKMTLPIVAMKYSDILEKARSHKYISKKRVGQDWRYKYKEDVHGIAGNVSREEFEGKTNKMTGYDWDEEGPQYTDAEVSYITNGPDVTGFRVKAKRSSDGKWERVNDYVGSRQGERAAEAKVEEIQEEMDAWEKQTKEEGKTFKMEGVPEEKFGWEHIKKDPNSFYNDPKMMGHTWAKEQLDLANQTLKPYIKTKLQKFLASNMLDYSANGWNYFAVHLSKKDIMITRMALRRIDKAMKEPGGVTGLLNRVQGRTGLLKSGLIHALEFLAYKHDRETYKKDYVQGFAYLGLTGKPAEDRFDRYHKELGEKYFPQEVNK